MTARRACVASVARVVIAAALAAPVALGCAKERCDDFVTLAFDIGGHATDACALVLDAGDGGASASIEYDFPAPTASSSCDGGPCTRSGCTTSAAAPSFCARTLADGHDRIVLQLETEVASALISRLGTRSFTATVTCAGAVAVDHEPKSADCIAAAHGT
jgi:hypothetical protein